MKKLLFCLLAATLLFSFAATANAAEIVASGTCGESLTWTLDDEGTLTICGTDAMTEA